MNIYALFPLIATIAYIPLLVTTASNRPWQRRHTLFLLFLIPAMMWSLGDYLWRSNFFPQHTFVLGRFVIAMFALMAVQFHYFTSSFFAPGQSRWLPFAYASLALIFAMLILGYIPEAIVIQGDQLHPDYGNGVLLLAAPLLTLAGRNLYVLWKRLKAVYNPILYNQIISLLLGYITLVTFSLSAILPWGKEFPISHFGNLINALILSYATIRHQLVDIRTVLRRGLSWVSLVIIGVLGYWLLLNFLHLLFNFELNMAATAVATVAAVVMAVFIYRLRNSLFTAAGWAFQGRSYDYRRKLADFAYKIQNIFSLKEQGGELLALVTQAIGCRKACLLFPEAGSKDFTVQFVEPKGRDNPLSSLRLREDNPIIDYLERERKLLMSETLAMLPEFRGLWQKERDELEANEIDLFVPLISRGRLIGILVLDKKPSGRYSLEDFNLLEDVSNQVAVSMEKEFLREQLRERERELSVINRSSAILSSSLDIQEIYDSFIMELKKVVDVNWAAIVLIEENELYFLALSSEIGSAWQLGEHIPSKGSATEWVTSHQKTIVEPDLTQQSLFATGKYHLKQGVRSIAYLPLIAKGNATGSLIVASRHPNAYNQRQIVLLEQLASQIAMSVENARLYAQAEEKARVDDLTGLLNRRSLDEMITSEIGRHSRYGGAFSMIILDLDSFKAFNDRYGHLAGDRLLKQVGTIIKGAIRSADQAFRYGGDEFAILLPQTAIDAARQVAERVREQLASRLKSRDIPVTASLGLASWPADGIAAVEIIAAADAALYQAKHRGGNQSYCSAGVLALDEASPAAPGSNQGDDVLSTIYALATTVDARDYYTPHHSQRVTEYALALGKALNMEPAALDRLETSARLHDIGKIAISDEVLNKQDKLTAEEWELVRGHPRLGATIVSRVSQLAPCATAILHHHEQYDGHGYPAGLKGKKIPLEARILAIADAFTAMTSPRPYSAAMSPAEALAEIQRGAGKQFDPQLVGVFASVAPTVTPLTVEEII